MIKNRLSAFTSPFPVAHPGGIFLDAISGLSNIAVSVQYFVNLGKEPEFRWFKIWIFAIDRVRNRRESGLHELAHGKNEINTIVLNV